MPGKSFKDCKLQSCIFGESLQKRDFPFFPAPPFFFPSSALALELGQRLSSPLGQRRPRPRARGAPALGPRAGTAREVSGAGLPPWEAAGPRPEPRAALRQFRAP